MRVADIQRAVAETFEMPIAKMAEPLRRGLGKDGRNAREVHRPRQVAMFLARDLTGYSYPRLGRIFERDHTTVIHAVRTIPKLAENDSELREKINRIRDLMALETNDFPPGYQNAERCEDMVGA